MNGKNIQLLAEALFIVIRELAAWFGKRGRTGDQKERSNVSKK